MQKIFTNVGVGLMLCTSLSTTAQAGTLANAYAASPFLSTSSAEIQAIDPDTAQSTTLSGVYDGKQQASPLSSHVSYAGMVGGSSADAGVFRVFGQNTDDVDLNTNKSFGTFAGFYDSVVFGHAGDGLINVTMNVVMDGDINILSQYASLSYGFLAESNSGLISSSSAGGYGFADGALFNSFGTSCGGTVLGTTLCQNFDTFGFSATGHKDLNFGFNFAVEGGSTVDLFQVLGLNLNSFNFGFATPEKSDYDFGHTAIFEGFSLDKDVDVTSLNYGALQKYGGKATYSAAASALGFSPAGAVPEPATWAMMLSGFGLVGGAMRRRRSNVQVSFA